MAKRNTMEKFADKLYQKALEEHPELWDGATLEDSERIFDRITDYYIEEIRSKVKTSRQGYIVSSNLFEHIAAGLS